MTALNMFKVLILSLTEKSQAILVLMKSLYKLVRHFFVTSLMQYVSILDMKFSYLTYRYMECLIFVYHHVGGK
jgi:hypothetical protein